MNKTIEIYSKGLYSSWCYHIPTRTLFDCGEGFASYQGNYAYGVERVMISHGHGDHVLGLPSFIGCRASARGDHKKSLDIYYPYGDPLVESVREFVMKRNRALEFDVNWHPIDSRYNLQLTPKLAIEAFPMAHQKGSRSQTLGYRITETRNKLRPEYEGKNIPALLKSGVAREDLHVSYNANLFAYALDSFQVHQDLVANANMAIMDCTFLRIDDRTDMTHYTIDEALEDCKAAGVKKMVAAHFSPRYMYPEIKGVVDRLNKANDNMIIPVFHNQVSQI